MSGIGLGYLQLERNISVQEIDAQCGYCGAKGFGSLRINEDSVSRGGFFCTGCGKPESFLLSAMRHKENVRSVDLSRTWSRFHQRLMHYTLRAAKDPALMTETRCLEVLHEASTICGRKDVADFDLRDLKFVLDYIYRVAEKAGLKGWTANEVLTIRAAADDVAAMRPLIYQAELVATILSPATVLMKVFGFAAIGTGMMLPARAKRAGTVYTFGYLAFLLMSPK